MEHEDIILDSIWSEMEQANTNVFYAELLIDKHLKRNKLFNAFVTCFSIGGAGFGFIDMMVPAILCGAMAIAEIIKSIFPCFIMKPDDISRLSSLSIRCDNYFYTLKKVFDNLFCDKIDSEKAEEEYYKAIKNNSTNKEEISRLFGKIDKKLNSIAAQKNEKFLNKIYHG